MTQHILTVDVEDNFTYEELANKSDWYKYEKQVVGNTRKLINLFTEYDADATFFIVGKVAERHPEIVSEIAEAGFEVASHSYAHERLDEKTKDEIEEDISHSADILKKIINGPVDGFRAMDFSIPQDEGWFFNLLKKHGFLYDSSKRGCKDSKLLRPGEGDIGRLFPSRVKLLNRYPIFSGGSFIRLLPFSYVKKGFADYDSRNQPVVCYVHPWEFNRDQPKRNVSLPQRIKQSPLTFNTEKRLKYLMSKYKFISVRKYFAIQ